MPVNPKTGKRYRISDDGKNRLHIYGTPGKKGVRHQSSDYRVVKLARPKGYIYNPKNTSYYKIREDKGGLTRQHVYQSGRVVNAGAGSSFKKSGIPSSFYNQAMNTWNITNQPTINTLTKNRGRERAAQNAAYGQIAGYYAGLGGTTKSLMGEAGRVGQATDAQVKQIGLERDQSIRSATPQFGGPLGMVAQNMADAEQQAALNRGASADAANRTFGVQTSGGRQALMGQVGAGQAIAGQERLSTMKGQGNQALLSYTDKINEIEGQKPAKVLDTARQLQYDQQALGVKMAEVDRKAQADADRAAAANKRNQIAQQNANKPSGGGGGSSGGGSGRGPSGGATKGGTKRTQNEINKWWDKTVMGAYGYMRSHTYTETQVKYGEAAAAVARALGKSGMKSITPYAHSMLVKAGYSAKGRYPVR